MKLSPEALTVLRGDDARFTCTPSKTKWTVMVWLLDGTAVLTISKEFGVLPSVHPNVTAEKGSVSSGDSWVFVLKKTERRNQGQVTCDLQGSDRRTASLFVQEKGSVKVIGDSTLVFKGQSVLFGCHAAGWYPLPTLQWHVNNKTVSRGDYNISSEESGESLFTEQLPPDSGGRGGAAGGRLHRRQAKQSPQEAAIRFGQSVSGRSLVAEATGGKVNLGYSSEGPTDPVYSELNLETRRQQQDFVSFLKVPDVVSSSSRSLHDDSQAQVCLSEETAKNIRRITTV
ncbi:Immunoglobulin superfamily member 5 [Dissostichus eleginoides]|nr:Immunoglobulin superfamily member 5 [Dissostichus eleginoides]